MFKKLLPFISVVLVLTFVLAACAPAAPVAAPAAPAAAEPAAPAAAEPAAPAAPAAPAGKLTAGVAIYKFDDTFMTAVRNAISEDAKSLGVDINLTDSQNAQATQNDQVDLFVSKKVNAMAINPVDLTAAGTILDKAKAAGIPIVFFNRQPLEADMAKWDKVYYVGAVAKQSGEMEGKLLVDYWKAHPEADKNKDGVMQYIMLTGEPGHQDAILRTKWSVDTITAAGIKVEKLAEDTAMWDRPKAQDKMAAFISKFGDKIEAVITNNDDMGLGAIGALKAAGYFGADKKFMPVVGVDATSAGVAALKDGTMLGTVLNDAVNQGKATMNLTAVLAAGQVPTDANVGYKITDGKYIWVDYKPITLANIADAGQ
ncbi:MAG: galactose ABC transporter substrate-binding protein [Leptolinea sp.]